MPSSQATDGQNHPWTSSTAIGSVVVAVASSEIPSVVSPQPGGPTNPNTLPGSTMRSTTVRSARCPPLTEPCSVDSPSRGVAAIVSGGPKGQSILIERMFD